MASAWAMFRVECSAEAMFRVNAPALFHTMLTRQRVKLSSRWIVGMTDAPAVSSVASLGWARGREGRVGWGHATDRDNGDANSVGTDNVAPA